ncbi:MAG: BON domain-containing protein [Bacteroidota bacterium]|nr:BON domain-containing protein [Bacteroidota bacterium]
MATSNVKQEIKDQFIWDDRILSSNIFVDIMDGTVKLSGEVPDLGSRKAAEEDALSISGVKHVENNIKVTYPESIVIPTDEQIKDSLIELLNLDDGINAKDLAIKVSDGVVTMNGTVDASWKKDVIQGYSYRITGVKDVIDQTTIKHTREYSDEEITTDIKKAFQRNDPYTTKNIRVEVQNGRVTLSGKVPSYVTRMRVKEMVKYTSGVGEVIDDLVIGK